MRRPLVLVSSLLAAVAAGSFAFGCSSDDTVGPGAPAAVDAGSNAAADATPAADTGAVTDTDAAARVTVLAQLDKAQGQLPEGLWEVSPDAVEFVGSGGTPITAWAPTASLVKVAGGTFETVATLGSAPAQSTYTLGITTSAAHDVFVAVAAAAAPPNDPAPGIYRIPAGGGAASAFSLGSAATPPMNFANGLDFIGSNLFVADSEGVVYQIGPNGVASVWSQDPLLAPDAAACGGKVPLPIGANGIAHDEHAVYVTNTNHGRLVKIPISGDGSAGAATVIKEDCATLVGADGLLIDPRDHSFLIALNALDEIVRLSADGASLSVIAAGPPLANPASLVLDGAGAERRLLVSSPAFFKDADGGAPNLASLELP